MLFRASLNCGQSHKVWAMMSGICSITVPDGLIFHCITPGHYLSRPAKDASPKVRKSPHPLHQCGNKSTVFGVWEELQPCAGLIICTKAGKHATIVHRRALST